MAAAALLRGSDHPPQVLANVVRMEAAAEVIHGALERDALTARALGADLTDLNVCARDSAEYARVIARRSASDTAPAEYDRLDETTARLLDQAVRARAALSLLSPRGEAGLGGDMIGLSGAAQDYGHDAARERRAARGFLLVAAAATLLAAAALAWGLTRMGDSPGTARLQMFGAHLASAVVLAAAAFVSLRAADRRGRVAGDHHRQQRQLSAVDAYLAPLPDSTRHLLRAALAPRLFSRSIDDDDPLRDPVWPSPAEVLQQLPDPRAKTDSAAPPEGVQGGGGGGGGSR